METIFDDLYSPIAVIIPARRPNKRAALGDTNPAAGVMVANPAIAPVAQPIVVGLPIEKRSIRIQIRAAALAATWVLIMADDASAFAPNAEPPLKPEPPHPEQTSAYHG